MPTVATKSAKKQEVKEAANHSAFCIMHSTLINVTKYIKCNTIPFGVVGPKCCETIDFMAFLVYSYSKISYGVLQQEAKTTETNFTNFS